MGAMLLKGGTQMAEQPRNVLYYGDNLQILRNREYFPSESIDLIYLDPPFKSNQDYIAIGLIKSRLRDAYGDHIKETYTVIGEPTDVAGAESLAQQDPFQFQSWALGLVGASPSRAKAWCG
jgi:hypothetical protein